MKVKFLSLLGILCLISSFVSCSAANKKTAKYSIQPDSTVYYTLGKTMSDILFSPTKVTCYTIQGKSIVSEEDVELEPHYVRDSLVAKLDDGQISILQFNLLSDDANYHQDSLKVRSPYVPYIEFCFEKKRQQPVHIIVSLSDFSWTILYDDKRQGNWNYADKRLMKRYCRMILGKEFNKIK
ncbi:hypothetical protein H6B13_09620 [Bacteroides gallinaceum]|uniref:hypothetical protein n=1 Tax=Bacteroides gallinaceum TaxID=1462571 RepID=UPI00195E298F|nr:hypothetical protein [Bacteroides gallinaceum]MBM6719899.1 hypothetical protein [Bacteroides gallinaceum]